MLYRSSVQSRKKGPPVSRRAFRIIGCAALLRGGSAFFVRGLLGGGGVARLARLAGGVAGFGAADYQLAAHEVFVVQFGDGAAGFLDGKHCDEGEAFGLLGVFVAYDLGVLDLADSVEELEEVTLGGVEGEVPDVDFRGVDFDEFGLARLPGCGSGGAGLEAAMAVIGLGWPAGL